jgi:dienelactone hydrolase
MGRVREVAAALAQQGYVAVVGETVSVTESGRRVAATLVATQEEILDEFLEEWSPHDHRDVEALVAPNFLRGWLVRSGQRTSLMLNCGRPS